MTLKCRLQNLGHFAQSLMCFNTQTEHLHERRREASKPTNLVLLFSDHKFDRHPYSNIVE